MDAVMQRKCNGECGLTLPLTVVNFEAYGKNGTFRFECKKCRSAKKAGKAKAVAAAHDPASVPKPDACVTCGKGCPEVDFKWRSDTQKGGWRSSCNKCYGDKEYHTEYRKREREKDKEAFLARNAKNAAEWRARNPENVREQQMKERMDPDRRIKSLVTEAKARGIDIDIQDLESMKAMMSMPCTYCNYVPVVGRDYLNGLDRVDNRGSYTASNVVPACGLCNDIKGPQHIDEFIDSIRRIKKHLAIEDPTGRSNARALGGHRDARDAPKKDKRNTLTVEQKINLWSHPCYMCGRAPSFGIDRFDSDGDYTVANSRPCCTNCNYMKSDRTLDEFKHHVAAVAVHTQLWVLKDVSGMSFKTWTGIDRKPVAVLDSDGQMVMIFPSAGCAADTIGVARPAITKAVRTKCQCRGHLWTEASAKEYREQAVGQDSAHNVIVTLRK